MNSQKVLEIFKEITNIPRESGHEAPMTEFLLAWAKTHKLQAKKDDTGNVCIIKEAAAGKENVPTLVLQSHQDMVCEKNAGVNHDFAKDPIRFEIKDGWMVAPDTTLGADDGIGIAASLALLESDLPTGKLECVFTISEETGMDGAFAMQEGFFTGKTLINLDSEDEGQMFIGCAGGLNSAMKFKYGTAAVKSTWKTVCVKISKATGGHSGDDINKGRINAVQQLAFFLREELNNSLQLIEINGGGKSNAIAREASAIIAVPSPNQTAERFAAFGETLKEKHKDSDPDVCFSCEIVTAKEEAIDQKTAENIIISMAQCTHGVVAMSKDIEGLVQTSTNLASVKMQEGNEILISTSQRSSVMEEREDIANLLKKHFEKFGASVRQFNRYPGWQPNMNSGILKQCCESYKKLFGNDPLVLAIHAGLECGLFLDKFPGLDMISFGPTLRGVHAPGERMELASLDKFVLHLTDVVCNFK